MIRQLITEIKQSSFDDKLASLFFLFITISISFFMYSFFYIATYIAVIYFIYLTLRVEKKIHFYLITTAAPRPVRLPDVLIRGNFVL
jgi:O-antigen ligase